MHLEDRLLVLTLSLLTVWIFLSCAKPSCPTCPQDFTVERRALIDLYDWNRDGCITEVDDIMARDELADARGAVAFNAWRLVLGQCRVLD